MPVNPSSPNTGLLYQGSLFRKYSSLLSNNEIAIEYGLQSGTLVYRVRKSNAPTQGPFFTIDAVVNSLTSTEDFPSNLKESLKTRLTREANIKLNLIEASNPRPNTINNQTAATTPSSTTPTAVTQGQPTTTAGEPKPEPSINATVVIGNLLDRANLSYPKNLVANKQTYVEFKSYDFSLLQKTKDVYGIVGELGSNFIETAVKVGNAQLNADVKPYSSDVIKLYVPPGINVSYGANWGVGELGPALGYKSGDTGVPGALKYFGGAALISGSEQIKSFADQILTRIPSANLNRDQLIGFTTGLVSNKNEFSTFENMQFRTFNYSFLFVARNQNERDEINKIINVFKIGMHPFSGTSTQLKSEDKSVKTFSNYRTPILKYPKIWTIEYKIENTSNKFLPKTKYCALQNVSLNYTPNSVFSTLVDNSIPAIQMDLSFTELTTLTGNEIVDGQGLGGEYQNNNSLANFNNVGIDDKYAQKDGGSF